MVYGWISDDVDESEGVMYSVDEARWNWSRLLQEHDILFMPGPVPVPGREDLVDTLGLDVWLADVRSQWRLMKMGMSEKARKRWVFI